MFHKFINKFQSDHNEWLWYQNWTNLRAILRWFCILKTRRSLLLYGIFENLPLVWKGKWCYPPGVLIKKETKWRNSGAHIEEKSILYRFYQKISNLSLEVENLMDTSYKGAHCSGSYLILPTESRTVCNFAIFEFTCKTHSAVCKFWIYFQAIPVVNSGFHHVWDLL